MGSNEGHGEERSMKAKSLRIWFATSYIVSGALFIGCLGTLAELLLVRLGILNDNGFPAFFYMLGAYAGFQSWVREGCPSAFPRS